MHIIHAIFLGILQGLTEFFPVSSSAHLELFSKIFSLSSFDPFFYLSLHLGTVCSSIIFFRHDIKKLLFNNQKELIFYILAIFPLIPIYFLAGSYIKNIPFNGINLIITGSFLLLALLIPFEKKPYISPIRKSLDVLFIGMMQALALIPGFSRSGLTISSAKIRGWPKEKAIRFSFMLAIPTIMGGTALELLKMNKETIANIDILPLTIGFIVSFAVGMLGINGIFIIAKKGKMKFIAIYCILAGLIAYLI